MTAAPYDSIMAIRVSLHHKTSYHYDRSIVLGPQVIRLRPAPHCRTPVLSYSLQIEPAGHFINWQQDPLGNYHARVVFPERTDRLVVEVDLVAELAVINPFDFFLEPEAEEFPFAYEPGLRRQLDPYLEQVPQGPAFAALLAEVDRSPRASIDFLVDLNRLIQGRLEYLIRMEHGVQTPEETLEIGSGSCRDFAWLEVQLLRHVGLAARFVSGYSIQLRPDTKPLEGPAGVDADCVDLHAWAEVYLPGAGWIGLDSTSGLLAGEGHLPLAATPEPSAAAPIEGAVEKSEATMDVVMEVTRIEESPRSTKPFSDRQWQGILVQGDAVDARLEAADMRLTMGGEPTFVSADDLVSDQWTVAAVGEDKRRMSEELIWSLRARFAPKGVLHYGQGKWYPGESLPRWALGCYWRRDGEPIWLDERWLLKPEDSGDAGAPDAERFARALAARLGVARRCAVPAYEDVAYYLWREQRLPVDVDPRDPKLDDAEERSRIAAVFERGLGTPVAYVLPLERRPDASGTEMVWQSSLWMLRARPIFLVPGDSPAGLRLPLASLPVGGGGEPLYRYPVDPTAPHPPLPPRARLGRRQATVERNEAPRREQAVTEQELPSEPAEPAPGEGDGTIRTALCVEPVGGRLTVFLPPVRRLEDYLDLVAAIEETAAELEMPVLIGGYTPPADPRLVKLEVTPDPGVIEVNVQPASSWRELVEITTGLYEDARQTRLQAIKYLVDGREVGTGGGNHIVVGGATPADSPWLRRPDLLRSVVAYWNNHPSLSYLFSSLFVGPTSQAPRVDQARGDSIHELELALEQVPDAGAGELPLWIVDRIFRHLLVDVTGNTHRAELCIDKLYSPDGVAGRLGLVELRSFEMTPHSRMNLVQQLLLRALLVHLWETPYRRRLVRWGTDLNDRFLLPHYVRQDFEEILQDLTQAGLEMPWEWFRPQYEFRFPVVGEVHYDEIGIRLRTALEPWLVLGEEPGGGGTVRFVDSSVERLQVEVTGLLEERYAVACNGHPLPLRPARERGHFVAGVRYRAWQPPHCLHPTIGVHTPLVFDLVDTWSQRAVAGCTYHVGHPGGRSYDEPPVNALEAEGRRLARFSPFGHTPGPVVMQPAEPDPEQPTTLDLRRLDRD